MTDKSLLFTRNYVKPSAKKSAVKPRLGKPVLRRHLGSSFAVSGILGRPVEAGRRHRVLFEICIGIVGWAKRSVPTITGRALEGGHASSCPPTARSNPYSEIATGCCL